MTPLAAGRRRQAERWLVFLARHLDRTIGGPDLAWWQLQDAAPRSTFRLAAGLVAGVVAGDRGRVAFGVLGAWPSS